MKIQHTVMVYASAAADECRIIFYTHAENALWMMATGRAIKREGKGTWVRSISLVPVEHCGPAPMRTNIALLPPKHHAAPHVSKRDQAPGAKRWVERLDRAQTGQAGGQRTVFLRSAAVM